MVVRVAAASAAILAALVAAGCGSAHPRSTTRAAGGTSECRLSAAQRRDVAAAKREIARMHRLQQPLTKWRLHGPEALELAVNRFLLDVGPLPVNEKERLMNKGKSAVGLCGDCFNAIEAMEPAVQTRLGRSPCAAR